MEPYYQTPDSINSLNHGENGATMINSSDFTAFYESTSTYYTNALLNIFGALAFTEGKPFRKTMFKNWIFIVWCAFSTIYNIIGLIAPWTDKVPFFTDINDWIFSFASLRKLSESFSIMWCCFLAIGCVATLLFERIIVYTVCYMIMLRKNGKIIKKEKE